MQLKGLITNLVIFLRLNFFYRNGSSFMLLYINFLKFPKTPFNQTNYKMNYITIVFFEYIVKLINLSLHNSKRSLGLLLIKDSFIAPSREFISTKYVFFVSGLGNVRPAGHMRPARHLHVARVHNSNTLF